MKKVFLVFLFLCFSSILFSQTVKTNIQADDIQWEYLVISFGKTIFETPEKMMAYKPIGLSNGNEAISLQSNLDILGRFGWEVISTLGVIGGDQQIILKRKYNKERSLTEYGLIQNGNELYLKELQDIIQRTIRLLEEQAKAEEAQKNKPKLINIDEQERLAKKEDIRKTLEANYKNALSKTDFKVDTYSLSYKNPYSKDVVINITVDLTEKFLLPGNSYRGNSVLEYLKSNIEKYRYKDSLIDKYTYITITTNGFILLNGEIINVSSYVTSLNLLGKWTDDY